MKTQFNCVWRRCSSLFSIFCRYFSTGFTGRLRNYSQLRAFGLPWHSGWNIFSAHIGQTDFVACHFTVEGTLQCVYRRYIIVVLWWCVDKSFETGICAPIPEKTLTFKFAGFVLHVAKTDPAPDHELHGHHEVAAEDSGMPEPIPEPTSRVRQCRVADCHLQTGAYQIGGKFIH